MAATLGVGADDIVIGEAVALDVPVAGFVLRVAGGLIDSFAGAVLFVTILIAVAPAVSRWDQALSGAFVVSLTVFLFVGLPTTIEVVSGGRSLGKLACGTRVVRDDTGPIATRQALVRALVGFVEVWVTGGVAAILTMLINGRGKRLGDLAAGTFVIHERVKLSTPPPAPMPPHLAAWAAGADIASLPTTLAMTVRQFLQRRESLAPASRGELASRLLADVRPHLSPQPPEWVNQEDILLAVIAERGRRDWLRLQREDALRVRLLGPR